MRSIQKKANVSNSRCAILIDDRPENNEAVRRARFSAIPVNERTGIRKHTVDKAILKMRECSLQNVRMRGTGSSALIKLAVAVVVLVTVIAVTIGLARRMSLSKIAAILLGSALLNVSLYSLT